EPPLPGREHGRRELQAALRSGLPVVIWHRAGRSTKQFRDVLDGLLADGLPRFPARMAAYRRRAAIDSADDRSAAHIGRHLTVLWDDPDRKPVLPEPP
ncbi:VMAP-C domain-containing protein, partial [Streptomyces sp. KR55]|uniref:VMAP-C domain-containing protein n=1 Tax=Streptomyces sp. KR55 TaxID=3457425 RepID=UPI003FD09685